MDSREYKSLSKNIENLDEETRRKVDDVFDRILGKIKKSDPKGYKKAMKRAEEEINLIKNNGGKVSDSIERGSSGKSGCT